MTILIVENRKALIVSHNKDDTKFVGHRVIKRSPFPIQIYLITTLRRI